MNLPIEAAERRRCYALGFVLRTDAELSLRLELRRPDGSAGATTDVLIEAAGTYAGVVEFEATTGARQHGRARPAHGAPVSRFIHDLFVMSYG